jgi:hypothetical protein
VSEVKTNLLDALNVFVLGSKWLWSDIACDFFFLISQLTIHE